MRIHEVVGGGGVRLHVREWGPAGARPILLMHGWSQHHMLWLLQYGSFLAEEFRLVAFDLRGHGMSDMPDGAGPYQDGALWAEDVAAVIGALDLQHPVLVAESYAGIVAGDYLGHFGDATIGGLVLVGGSVCVGRSRGDLVGPGLLANAPRGLATDQPTALQGMRDFVNACFVKPLPPEIVELAVGWNMLVPPRVRAALAARDADAQATLSAFRKPALIIHGSEDAVILPTMAKRAKEAMPHATLRWYEGCGHVPFLEDAAQFNEDLACFVRAV